MLDRVAPEVTIAASKTSVATGESVAFSSHASDATSGLGGGRWEWGDGSADTAAAGASHSFAQAGTYTVRYRVEDAAGNEAVAERSITVTAPSGPETPPETGGPETGGPETGGPGTAKPDADPRRRSRPRPAARRWHGSRSGT